MHNALTRQDGSLQNVLLHISPSASALPRHHGIQLGATPAGEFLGRPGIKLQVDLCKDVSKHLVKLMPDSHRNLVHTLL